MGSLNTIKATLRRCIVEIKAIITPGQSIKPSSSPHLASPTALPFIAGAIAALTTTNVLTIIGFGTAGIIGGSAAAAYQSTVYGGYVPAGCAFARMTSLGATGAMGPILAVIAVAVGIAVAVAMWRHGQKS